MADAIFACEPCKKNFATAAELAAHAREVHHHGETDYARMRRLAEEWEDNAPEGVMRFTHVSGGTIVLHKDGPDTEEPGWIKGAEFSTVKNILVHVEGGCVVDVYGMPDGYTYEVVDMDVFDGGDDEDQERLGFKQLTLDDDTDLNRYDQTSGREGSPFPDGKEE